jgi:polyisoprenoid-binding protein YceI
VVGDMAIHGVTKEVTIPLAKVFYENNRGRFKGAFEVNRKDYGLIYNSRLNPIEDIVKIEVDFSVQAR